jgi:preprotein translocase subunit SecG
MATVLLIIHIMIALAMIGLVLLQRSEGGALGIGGGGGGGFMTGRGAANFLTRATAGLAAAFFTTSLVLSLIASQPGRDRSILDQGPAPITQPAKTPKSLPQIPTTPAEAPAATKPPTDTPPPAPQAPATPRVPQSK